MNDKDQRLLEEAYALVCLGEGKGGVEDLIGSLKNEKARGKIEEILKRHPEWVEGLRAFKEKDEKGYLMSLGNFERNFVSDDLIKKMSEGKFLSYHNWM